MDLVNKPYNGLDPEAKRLALKALGKNPHGKITLETVPPVSKETHTVMAWAASMLKSLGRFLSLTNVGQPTRRPESCHLCHLGAGGLRLKPVDAKQHNDYKR